ncbi:protein CBFA2T3 isoform X4 [Phasianus colchicus]|uniref:CBFA2/RUNX1 partner transcriptional co-repressor 3 n=1 Tax=Phasianus colchicus TaxID=9054 RepID=A0A669R7N8_PHACC|nr:protein CBFA2T3 isoform X4 [Phasianus colchicus]
MAMPCCAMLLPVPSCSAPSPHREEVKPARRGSCWKVRPEWLIGKAELGLVADGSCWGRTRVQLPGLPPPAALSLPGSCSPSPSPWDTALLPLRARRSHKRPWQWGRHRTGRTPRAAPHSTEPCGTQPAQRGSCSDTELCRSRAGCATHCWHRTAAMPGGAPRLDGHPFSRTGPDPAAPRAATMPDSPADVKTQPRSTPPNMPPPPPAVTQGATRHPSFTPSTNRDAVPPTFLPRGRFHGCLKWSMVCLLMNGSSHSPTAINGAPSTPNGFSNGPATSSSASLSTHQLPPACGARQLSKLKRFLTTLQQFGNDISPEIGERVRTLVLGLVNSTLTIEEFHAKLQEATNFPLRPFVIPFLKANLPLLQRELLHCARMAKQSPAQYLAQHEQLLLDANASSPIDSSELLLEVSESGKRRTPDRTKENGLDRDPLHPEHLSKRPCTMSPAQRYSPSNGLSHPPNGLPHPPGPPPQHYRLEDMAMAHHYRDAYRHADPRERPRPAVHGARQEEVIDHRLTDREWAEEWKHLNNLLNCIMDMVEKTRRSLTVLRRCQEADREELNHWIRRYSDAEDMKKGSPPSARPHNSSSSSEAPQLDVHRDFAPRPLSGYMPEEIWRKAEEAVNEVKRQAMSELQKAVSDAERKAHELITTERAKMERALAEAKRQASEDALTVINQQEDSSESCWNCGRKASETCSGCNTARYCGSFCQHKDWEKHHHVCGQTLQGLPAPSAPTAVGQPEAVPPMASSPSDAGSAGASRAGTPGTPAPLESASR